jgi:hypothetical protein
LRFHRAKFQSFVDGRWSELVERRQSGDARCAALIVTHGAMLLVKCLGEGVIGGMSEGGECEQNRYFHAL